MLCCLFDTETTGLYNFNLPAAHEDQPDVVQLCAYLCDRDKIHSKFSVFVHADTEISQTAFETHRIDRDMTRKMGVSRRRACQMLDSFAKNADLIVGHNIQFDIKMMLTANIREGGRGDALKKASFCTMQTATDICKLPNPKFPGKFKWPSLQEAYKILVDPRGFEGAHDAEEDVKATYELFRVLHK